MFTIMYNMDAVRPHFLDYRSLYKCVYLQSHLNTIAQKETK